ncbi:MAG TPA: hypothetical protein VJ044_12295, partial [Candidatus Hodarchaeales archaeon]|nr:hypothetical protein [Candidatus Hodarchaeales archaeon]
MRTTPISVSIIGGSGYTGGELLRLMLFHPNVEVSQVTSENHMGKMVSNLHPNLRKVTDLKFSSVEELQTCDALFLCLPHGMAMEKIDYYTERCKKVFDLSADFR